MAARNRAHRASSSCRSQAGSSMICVGWPVICIPWTPSQALPGVTVLGGRTHFPARDDEPGCIRPSQLDVELRADGARPLLQ
jgi:hypothetical protein